MTEFLGENMKTKSIIVALLLALVLALSAFAACDKQGAEHKSDGVDVRRLLPLARLRRVFVACCRERKLHLVRQVGCAARQSCGDVLARVWQYACNRSVLLA